jgi:two-component system nitrate/nitrite response regulator NarL
MQLLSLRWESHVSVAGKMSSEKDFSIERLWNHADNAGRLAAPALSFRFYREFRQQVVCLLFESASRKHMHPIASRVYLWKKPLIFALCQSSHCCRLRAKFLFTVVTAIRDRLPRVLDCGLSQHASYQPDRKSDLLLLVGSKDYSYDSPGGDMECGQAGGKIIIRVLVADNSLIHTQSVADALRHDRNLEVLSSNPDVKAVIDAALEHNVDVLVISSNLDGQANRGFEVVRELHASRPELRAVVLIDSSKTEVIVQAFRAGARGVFTRFESIETLCKCVRCVHRGQIWANSHQMSVVLEALASSHTIRAVDAKGLSLLSQREMEIVQSLAEGLTNREIAGRLGLSQHTVKNYLFRVFDKLGASNRIELLFMTLSQSTSSQSVFSHVLKHYMDDGLQDASTLAECQQAAEQGVPIAQLALAQMFWNRKASSKDVVQAYKWYLIASGQVLQTGKAVSRAMTMEQLLHAEQMAADWLSKRQKIPAASIGEVTARPKRMGMGSAASD